MAREKAPAFQFYVSDYLTSERTRAMTNDARGVYVDMLAFSWKEVGLPAKLPVLARVIGQPETTLRKLWPQIKGAWQKRGARIYNPRQEEQRVAAHAHFEAQSDRGKKGALARWGKKNPGNGVSMPQALPADSSSSSPSVNTTPQPPSGGRSRKRALRGISPVDPIAHQQSIETRERRAALAKTGMTPEQVEAELEREYDERKAATA